MQFCQICKFKNNTGKIRAKYFIHTDTNTDTNTDTGYHTVTASKWVNLIELLKYFALWVT